MFAVWLFVVCSSRGPALFLLAQVSFCFLTQVFYCYTCSLFYAQQIQQRPQTSANQGLHIDGLIECPVRGKRFLESGEIGG